MSKFDVFISHASEDKRDFVKPLAILLSEYGVNVWFDEFTLELGDSLSRSIDKGLSESRYGVVVLSRAFFAKDWPEYELRGLVAKEIGGSKVILPVWHNIDRNDVLQYSPPLADTFAISSNQHSIEEIALKIVKVVRPDLFTKILRKIGYRELIKNAQTERIDPKSLKFGPPVHKSFPSDLTGRIRLVRAALTEVYPHSMKFWIDGFRRDSRPSEEVKWWEFLAACYLEFTSLSDLTLVQRRLVFKILIGLCMGDDQKSLEKDLEGLPDGAFQKIEKIITSTLPAEDFEDIFSEDEEDVSEERWMYMQKAGLDPEDYSS